MKRTILYLVTFILVPISAHAQTDIAGSWKQTAFYQKVLSTGERRFPFGEMIIGRIVYSKDGTFCTMTTGADRKQAAAAPTDEERVSCSKPCLPIAGPIGLMVHGSLPNRMWPGHLIGQREKLVRHLQSTAN